MSSFRLLCLLLGLAACPQPPVPGERVGTNLAKSGITIYEDPDMNVVCYSYGGGSLSCVHVPEEQACDD